MRMLSFLAVIPLFTLVSAAPQATTSNNCVATIASLGDVNNAVQCTTVNIEGFTVPAGQKFSLNLLKGTTVNVLGDVEFEYAVWEGPLFELMGEDITFNGNGKTFNGRGELYWDGLGSSGSIKPSHMLQIPSSGTFSDLYVRNCPEHCFSLCNQGPLVVSGVTVDNSEGNNPNDKSNGLPAGHNTDAFDITGSDLTIKNCTVINQDDCVAINKGQRIVIENNHCANGHGISIGSVGSNVDISDILIRGNTVLDSVQAFRIKTDRSATNSKVTNVTYTDNTAMNCTQYGVVITQSYPENFGTAGNGVIISDINFSPGTTDISVSSDAEMVAVNCGNCIGQWNWSGLRTSGGKVGVTNKSPDIQGYTQ